MVAAMAEEAAVVVVEVVPGPGVCGGRGSDRGWCRCWRRLGVLAPAAFWHSATAPSHAASLGKLANKAKRSISCCVRECVCRPPCVVAAGDNDDEEEEEGAEEDACRGV